MDIKTLKGDVSDKWIREYMKLFDSEEPKERDYLKNILHRLYAKIMGCRK